ncbi:MAG: nuclear transport factor 2 family protein, partial [Acidobacteria bacterium]|nr:nuclear transport factor 2 family protein [Acidobacteriota bacterium]
MAISQTMFSTGGKLMSQQSLVDVAKAPMIAFNQKDWGAFKTAIAAGFVYDEVATQRNIRGADEVIAAFQGWAAAFPDAKAEFHSPLVSGNTVILEVTWRGTHTGPLPTPGGTITGTGKTYVVRACQVFEVAEGKAQVLRHYFDLTTL